MSMQAVWQTPLGRLVVREPERAELELSAPRLAGFYNEPHNRELLANTQDMTPQEVVEHYAALWAQGGVPLWLELDDLLVGDADLRHVQDGVAETAILLGVRTLQGQGLGTRFNLMVHALAFGALGLTRLYATIIPQNVASQRSFAKLGHEPDMSPEARAYVDAEDDVSLSLTRERFQARHAALLPEISLSAAR